VGRPIVHRNLSRERKTTSRPLSLSHRNYISLVAADRTTSPRSLIASAQATGQGDFQNKADELKKALGGTSLYLVGMMGSGKSTIGNILSQALSYRFFDVDDLIEKSFNAPVKQLFEEQGEDAFRDIETSVMQELSQYTRSIVSTGGGAVLRRANWGQMHHGIVVFLNGTAGTLASRICGAQKEKRPLLKDVGDEQGLVDKLDAMLGDRINLYREADVEVVLEESNSGEALPTEQVTLLVIEKVLEKIESKQKEVEERKNFKVEGLES